MTIDYSHTLVLPTASDEYVQQIEIRTESGPVSIQAFTLNPVRCPACGGPMPVAAPADLVADGYVDQVDPHDAIPFPDVPDYETECLDLERDDQE
jgi:hypothetical protein